MRAADILRLMKFDTYGWISVSSLLVCVISGVLLAIPYDINDPYGSISLIMLENPAGNLFRNLHFWSAQLFLILTVVHIFDHFFQNTESNLGRGTWLRLTLTVAIVFFAMLSGFILKGDADAMQARRIFSNLLAGIPLVGSYIDYSLMGTEDNLQLIYIHHIATATILILIFTIEHVKAIWPDLFRFLITLFILIIISFFLRAPLHDGYDPVIKGPWYFIGLQEILHWMNNPLSIWWVFLVLFLLFYLIRESRGRLNFLLKRFMLVLGIGYLVLTIIGYFFRGENWEWSSAFDRTNSAVFSGFHPVFASLPEEYGEGESFLSKTGSRYEGCMVCHDEMTGLSASHDPAAIGCSSCHGGNPFTLHKERAHKGMILIPGNLSDASRSCGTAACHPVVTSRVHKSLMSTLSGMVSVNRFVFGESESLSVLSHIQKIGHTAADEHLRDLCAHCHLGNEKTELGPITQLSRGGGCNACHLSYDGSALEEIATRENWVSNGINPLKHPSLSVDITDEHCFGCHSRSGRIAFNYMGYHETLLEADQVTGNDKYHVLDDQRVMEKMPADVHHQAGMSCIDCHISFGLMGDGNLYHHEEEQVKIACSDCHISGKPESIKQDHLDYEAAKISRLRGYDQTGVKYLRSSYSGYALVNTMVTDTGLFLRGKEDGKIYPLLPPSDVCTGTTAHKNLDCNACHASRVPQCIGCHNSYDSRGKGFDLLEYREKEGAWIEYIGQYLSDQPVLGISNERADTKTIGTFAPGMILSIDISSFNGDDADQQIFHRLYSPVSPHTTITESRTCISCHLDPLAIGYGRGKMEYNLAGPKGYFSFVPRFANRTEDDLPEDAWIPFLGEHQGIFATRPWARPFNLEEQQGILLVGSCLHCHDEGSAVMEQSLWDFSKVLKMRSDSCVLPDWYYPE